MKHKTFGFETKSIDKDNATLVGVFSTGDVDRHGEIVDQKSWILDSYMQNPVVLWSHNHDELAIGKTETLYINPDGNLEGVMKFAVKENPKAKIIFDLFVGGFMKAFSVGFMSGEYDQREDGVVILKQNNLFEISAVNVPANAMALAKSKGIDVDLLEEKEGRVLSKKNRTVVENAVTALNELLTADTTEDKSGEIKSTDNGIVLEKKASVPADRRRKALTVLNKAIRSLYREQRL